jgi:hypothetical protein
MPTAWKKITKEINRPVLVTNNLKARDANGNMSHIWCVGMVHKTNEPGGPFVAFKDLYSKVFCLTHYAEIPN